MSQIKIFTGITFSWLRFVLGFIVAIIQIPIIFKHLPKEIVGVWFLFYSAAAFLQMSDFGLPSAVSRAVAYLKNNKIDSEQLEVKFYQQFTIRDIYISSFLSFSIISSVVVVIGTALILILRPGFGVNHALNEEVSLSFAIFIVGIFFNMTANIPYACLNGMGDVGYDNIFKILVQLLGLSSILILLPLVPSIKTLSFIYLGQGIISTSLVHRFLRIRHKNLFILKGKYNKELIKHLYKESIPLFINQIGGWLTNQSGIWIATILLGVHMIADYSILIQIVLYGLSISMSIPTAINPYAISAFASGGIKSLHKYFFLTLKISTFIVVFWIVILSFWGETILDLWIGKGHFLGIWVLIPLLLNLFFEMQHSICGGFVWNSGKWPFVPTTIAAGILNVIFGFIGCYYYGFIGLATGTMLAKLFTLNWYVVFYALKRLNISFIKYLNEFLRPILLISGSIYIFSILINYYFKNTAIQFDFSFRSVSGVQIVSLFSGIVIVLTCWAILYYKFVFTKDEKKVFKTFLNHKKNG